MPDHEFTPRVSRRTLVAGSAAVLAAGSLGDSATARQATPVPTADLNAFASLSELVVGVEDLSEELLQQSHELIVADSGRADALRELLDAGDSVDIENLSDAQSGVVTNILEFWYAGTFDGDPVENRADFFAQLISFRALPYSTLPAVCKNWGYWAVDLELPDRS